MTHTTRRLLLSLVLPCLSLSWAQAANASAGADANVQAKAEAAAKPLPWNWTDTTPTSTAPAAGGAKPPVLLPVRSDNPCPADCIRVNALAGDIQGTFDIKKGTSLIQALTMMGAEKYLTDHARIAVRTRATFFAKGGSQPLEANENVLVDVAAVRAGKAKDIVFKEIQAEDYQIGVEVLYDEFHFHGGSPEDFVSDVQNHFGVDWSIVQIPAEMRNIYIPEFRQGTNYMFSQEKPDGSQVVTSQVPLSTIMGVFIMYSQIAEKYPAVGTWTIRNTDSDEKDVQSYYHPGMLLLSPLPNRPAAVAPSVIVKAASLGGIPDEKWNGLHRDIERASEVAANFGERAREVGPLPMGTTSFQSDSKILVIIGNQSYIDMVESLVAAYDKNVAAETAAKLKPAAPR